MMKCEIPGLNKQQIEQIVNKVAENHKNKSFDCHDSDDIIQEVWYIALKALPSFDINKIKINNNIEQALENWLNTVVSRRLANFYRDSYSIKQKAKRDDVTAFDTQKRINLNNPIELSLLTTIDIEDKKNYHSITELYKILKDLTAEDYEILDSILSGQKINTYFKNKLIGKIKELLKCHTN